MMYRDHEITVDESTGIFCIKSGIASTFKEAGSFYTLREAKKTVDDVIQALTVAAKENINIQVLEEDASIASLRGINSVTGHLMGIRSKQYIYPYSDNLRPIIAEYISAKTTAERLLKTLRPMQIRKDFVLGRITADKYNEAINKLKKEIEEKKELAQNMSPPQ